MNRINFEIKPEDLKPLQTKEEEEQVLYEHSIRKDIWNGFCENKVGFVCVAFLLLIVIAALCAPLTKYDANAIDATSKLRGISSEHWLGTDDYGRDYFTRVLYGSQVSLLIGVFSMIIAVCAGTIIGTILPAYESPAT